MTEEELKNRLKKWAVSVGLRFQANAQIVNQKSKIVN